MTEKRKSDDMAKKKTRTRRRKKYFSIYDAAVAYGNLHILTEMATGYGPIGWVTGDFDLMESKRYDAGLNTNSMVWTGSSQISMRDMLNEPGQSFSTITGNVRANAVGATVNAVLFNVGANVLKKAMKTPIRNSNKIIRQLNMGVQI